jgi:PAS domain S-box-containing protein
VWNADLVGLAYDAALDPKRWVDFAEALERSLGDGVVLLAMPQPCGSQRGALIAPSLDSRFVESYRDRYFELDPWTAQAESLGVGASFLVRGARRDEKLAGSRFLREWLEPQDLASGSFLGCVVDRDERNGTSLLSVFRRGRTQGAGAGAALLLRGLLPHLRRALRMHFQRLQLEEDRQALASALDLVPIGIVLVDGHGRLRATNRAAERLLGARDGICIGRDGLRAGRPEDTARLREALARASRGAQPVGGGEALLLERPSGRQALQALVATLGPHREDEAVGSSLAGLFVGDPDEATEPGGDLLRSFFALTPAEAALARELVRGRSLAEAAHRLDITYGTARQRLGQVFAKTNTRRQAALVRLLLTGPAGLEAESR